MSKLEALKAARSVSDLAILLNSQPEKVGFFLYKVPAENKYTSFTIPKKTGGVRNIDAPVPQLKYLQTKLAEYLEDCLIEIDETERQNLDSKKKFSSASHGFKKEHSIITNARPHRRKRWVLNLDLKDFFPSINFGRVRGFFIKNKHFRLSPTVANTIAHIACYKGTLPQGSPCSPIISNLIGHLLDIRLIKIAKKYSCTYTRYADDITFSSDLKKFPTQIAYRKFLDRNNWILGTTLKKEIEKAGFYVNDKKTRMQYRGSRQDVTSLVVNKKVNVKRDLYKRLRAQCHTLFLTGECYEIDYKKTEKQSTLSFLSFIKRFFCNNEQNNKNSDKKTYKKLAQIQGMLDFVYQVRHHGDKALEIGQRKKITSSIKTLYQKFLFFINFYYIDRPLIICEGKTDAVYLKCALKSLYENYPILISKNRKDFEFKVKFFTYSDIAMDILGLGGGCGDLAKLIRSYNENCAAYRCSGLLHPVIIIIDNDEEPKNNIFPAIKDITRSPTPILGDQSFYAVTRNLYVVTIPKLNGKPNTVIEHFFEDNVFEMNTNGRKFHPDKTSADGFNCTKNDFAEQIVRKNQKQIVFTEFTQIFDRVMEVMGNYYTRRSSF